jgi:hypothetical protein
MVALRYMQWCVVLTGAALALLVGLLVSRQGELNDLSIYHDANWWQEDSSFAILRRMNAVRVWLLYADLVYYICVQLSSSASHC